MSEITDFINEFSAAMDKFGADYMAKHGSEVDGEHLICALVRWTAATIASAPVSNRKVLLFQAVERLHNDMAEIENMHGNPLVTQKRRLN